jgi:DNA-binding CsgD family transcriptional regulator
MMDGVAALSIDCVGRFRCTARHVMDYIDSVLSEWMRERCGPPPKTFLLPRGGAAPPLRLTVIAPPSDPDSRFFRGPECTVLIEDPTRNLDVVAEEFGALYRLTPAEIRVVAGLAAGLTLSEISVQAGIAPGTARVQLKQVFAKTGIGRQTDLIRNVCLLAGTVLEPPAGARKPAGDL